VREQLEIDQRCGDRVKGRVLFIITTILEVEAEAEAAAADQLVGSKVGREMKVSKEERT
jgi:hypothetical protein